MQLVELENRILSLRMELNEAVAKSKNGDRLEKIKIQAMQNDLILLQNQLNIIKKNGILVDTTEPIKQESYIKKEQVTVISDKEEKPQETKHIEKVQEQNKPAKPKKEKNLEKIFGQSIMGILASLLIFISMIIFSALVLPLLPEAAKLMLMYIGSIGLTAVGLGLLKKDNKNKLHLSLSGCGVGAVYVSLFLTNLYFHVIGDILLYIALLVWSVFMCYLAKTKSSLFVFIGQVGITISAIFGLTKCFLVEDPIQLMMLIVFCVITEACYLYAFNENKNVSTQIGISIIAITFASLSNMSWLFATTEIMAQKLVMSVFILAIIAYLMMFKNSIMSKIIILVDFIAAYAILQSDIVFSVIAMFLIITNIFLNKGEEEKRFEFFELVLGIFSILLMVNIYITGISLCIIPLVFLIVIGYLYRNKMLKIASYIILFIYHFSAIPINSNEQIVFTIMELVVALSLGYMCYRIRKDDKLINIATYIFQLSSVLLLVSKIAELICKSLHPYDLYYYSYSIEALWSITVVFIINTFAYFILNKRKENSLGIYIDVVSVINALIMFSSLLCINSGDGIILQLMAIIVAIASFVLNSKRFIETKIGGFYVGAKFLVLMLVILNSFNATNFIVSICCFLMACSSIWFGFINKYKSLRIFGLILSCISVCKLVLFDISYDSSLMKAASFFICGVICFGINMIYNKLGKNIE